MYSIMKKVLSIMLFAMAISYYSQAQDKEALQQS
jgi:hypothetical protein